MATVNDLTQIERDLQQQLKQIEADKVQAAEQERQDKQGRLKAHEDRAASYRRQATKALDETEKRNLYSYAEEQDELATQLRIELGIVSEQQVIDQLEQQKYELKQKTARKINRLFIKSVIAFALYLLADYVSGQMDVGFISFVLRSAGYVAYGVAATFGGCWLIGSLFYESISDYVVNVLPVEFWGISPTARLTILTALFSAILFFLANSLHAR